MEAKETIDTASAPAFYIAGENELSGSIFIAKMRKMQRPFTRWDFLLFVAFLNHWMYLGASAKFTFLPVI